MKNKAITAAALFFALIFTFGVPAHTEAASCSNPCGGSYNGYTGYQNVQYPIPQYVYYQDPARYAKETYTPVFYPIPLYVQTGINSNGTTRYGSNPSQALSYTPSNYPTMNYNYGQQTSYGNNGYNGYGNGGFTISGGSQANSNGASSGGFINTSGR